MGASAAREHGGGGEGHILAPKIAQALTFFFPVVVRERVLLLPKRCVRVLPVLAVPVPFALSQYYSGRR